MVMIFPNNNLPVDSQPWGREITKQLIAIIDSNKTGQINNAARDNQLNSSIVALTGVVNNISTITADSTAAINGLISLASTGSAYKVNGDNLQNGTITGLAFQTATSGRRIAISGTSQTFYDDDGVLTGTITASGSTTTSNLEISVFTDSKIKFESGTVILTGLVTANNGIQSTDILTYGTGAGGVDVYASLVTGRLGIVSSSRDTKQEIQDLNLDVNAILSINPKTFKYNVDVEALGLDNAQTVSGFIAEDLDDAGLGYFVKYDEDGKPKAISYSGYVVALQAVVKDLNKRITKLENGV